MIYVFGRRKLAEDYVCNSGLPLTEICYESNLDVIMIAASRRPETTKIVLVSGYGGQIGPRLFRVIRRCVPVTVYENGYLLEFRPGHH